MRRIEGSPTQGLLGATLGFFVGFAAVALYGPTAARFQQAMGLTPLMVGFLVAMPALSGSLLRIPFAAWADTSGGRKPFLVLLGLSVVGLLGLTSLVLARTPEQFSPSLYPALLLLGLLCGCGIATFSVGVGQVSYWFPQRQQGAALGFYAGVGNLAPGLFSLAVPLAQTGWGLGACYVAWLSVLVAGAFVYALTARNAPYFQLRDLGAAPDEAAERARVAGQEVFPSGTLRDSLWLSAQTPQTWLLVAIYVTTFGGFLGLTAWFPTYWHEYLHVEPTAAAQLAAMFAILASLVRIQGGRIADRFGGEKAVLWGLAMVGLGGAVVTCSTHFTTSLTGEVMLAIGMGVANAAVFKVLPAAVPQAVGGAAGWVGGLGAFGGFALPPLMGAVVRSAGRDGYGLGFGLLVVLAWLSILAGAALLRQAQRPPMTAVGDAGHGDRPLTPKNVAGEGDDERKSA